MKSVLRITISLAAVCALSAALGALAKGTPAEPDGAALFKQNCAMCHGADGKGYSALKTPDFTDKKWQESVTDKQIFDTIKNGKSNTMMLPFGNKLNDAEMNALVKQIRAFGGGKSK
jgi:cytochrome c oxidase cbb3-type subunit III